MFVQKKLYIHEVADYLNELVQQGLKVVSYTIKDDSKTLDVVHVVVEVKKVRSTKKRKLIIERLMFFEN